MIHLPLKPVIGLLSLEITGIIQYVLLFFFLVYFTQHTYFKFMPVVMNQ